MKNERCDLCSIFIRQPAEKSMEGQLHECSDYAQRNGMTVVNSYIVRKESQIAWNFSA